ncbi:hypothetical protein Thimo_3548 [Thioflavicoccus mobilis 8321]|uniref:Uncharacterized protein n=1 Tax=Thioflavicoccus mobilis 8321 TaxID=765912 RepID=L0H3G2_9GAMM|nr:Sfum_1244 family protein [Thioflavicoccus mobilis]AGA92205.1 hypothetical protein Thimo_3548 [Thioflavicoccus mobilis 8321]
MSPQQLGALAGAVQHNCHVCDARHGADYSLCIYLMKMREYYRWEQGLPFGSTLGREAVGDWLQAREQLWEALEEADVEPISIDGRFYDPYDAEAINQALAGHGLVYSGGLGRGARPHFFLGNLERRIQADGHTVYVAATEHARDLISPPAMTLGDTIFLRREALLRLLWEKLEGWRWSRPDNALGRAFACYDFDADLEGSLEAMTDREIANTLLHERGEHRAGGLLGDADWNAMLLDLVATPAEPMARAVRDHLADCLVTLPQLAEAGEAAALHFYVGNLTPLRRDIFPSLARAYETWRHTGDTGELAAVAGAGRSHWRRLAEGMLALHRARRTEAVADIRELIEGHRL